MSNPMLTTTNSKLDTRVKEPSGVGSPTNDRFKIKKNKLKLRLKIIFFNMKFSYTNILNY